MIDVQVRRMPDGTVAEIKVTGHAGFADPGQDIVCAGVSALVVTALIGLKRVAAHPHEGKAKGGLMYCRVKAGGTPESALKAQAILETVVHGLCDIAKDYHQFVHVTEGG